MTIDEFEALRLADLEGLYQDAAAKKMHVSRQTFGRIVESARRKVAEALVHAKALKIGGGVFMTKTARSFCCRTCKHNWQVPSGTGRPPECPVCHGKSLRRTAEESGGGGDQICCQPQNCPKTKAETSEKPLKKNNRST